MKGKLELVEETAITPEMSGTRRSRPGVQQPDEIAAGQFDAIKRIFEDKELDDDKKVDKINEYITSQGSLPKQVAMKLIEARQCWQVAENLENFEGLDNEVAIRLIEARQGRQVAKNLEKFEGLDHQEVAMKLIEAGEGVSVARNLEKFEGLNPKEAAMKLIEAGAGLAVGDNLEKFKGLDHKEVAMKLIEAGQSWAVAVNLEKFEGLNHKEVAMKLMIEQGGRFSLSENLEKFKGLDKEVAMELIEAGEGWVAAENLDKFDGLDEEVAMKLFEVGQGRAVAGNLEKFEGLDKEVAMKLIEAGYGLAVVGNLEKFEGLKHKDVAMKLIDARQGWVVAGNLEKFEGLNHQDVAMKLFQVGQGRTVAGNLEKFEGLNHQDVAMKLFQAGEGLAVVANLDKFEGLNHKEVAMDLIQARQFRAVAENLDKFESLDEEVVRALVNAGHIGAVVNNLAKLPFIKNNRILGQDLFASCLVRDWNIEYLRRLNDLYKPTLDENFVAGYELLGDFLTPISYELVRDIKAGKVDPEEMKKLGISRGGATGVNQVRQQLVKFKSQIIEPDFDFSKVQNNPLLSDYFKGVVRFKESQWGEHGDEEFQQIINRYHELQAKGEIKPLGENYEPSRELRVKKVDAKAREEYKYSEQFLARYGVLQGSLKQALELLQQKRPLKQLAGRVQAKRQEVLAGLEEKLGQMENLKARQNLETRIKDLKSIDITSIKEFEKNFSVLSQFPEFHEELRQLMFYYALDQHENYRESAQEMVRREKPQFDDVGWMINFIEHIVNEETWAEYFTDDKAAKAFRKLINVNAINEEFSRAQNQEAKGTMSMKFVPTRGLLMEFSGHIADACWASKYDSIAKKFPNFTAVAMVQNPGSKHERLAGACLLIETEAEDGAPLLVIRGLNPVENVINSLVVEDFFEKITRYGKSIAEKTGRKLSIVIDDHLGGAATNRPALFEYLEAKQAGLKRIQLASTKDTEFNGYNIVNDTYILE